MFHDVIGFGRLCAHVIGFGRRSICSTVLDDYVNNVISASMYQMNNAFLYKLFPMRGGATHRKLKVEPDLDEFN